MNDLQQNIKNVNDKLQKLLRNYLQLQKDNERQSRLIAALQQSKQEDDKLISQLKDQVSILKSATGQLSEDDKKEFEKTISRYIKEIDKCISLLSE